MYLGRKTKWHTAASVESTEKQFNVSNYEHLQIMSMFIAINYYTWK
jgi:hypothetical protein